MTENIRAPKCGGTFVYCPLEDCTSQAQGVLLKYTRFRTMKAYRRHWRRQHAHVG